MNPHLTYFAILILSLAGPLALSFDKKVHFYTKWKFLLPATIFPALAYMVWDAWFTRLGVWSFNSNYITGIYLFNLPIEEVLFFFVVPYCCVFIYECIRVYFPKMECTRNADICLALIGVAMIIIGVFNSVKLYTATTAIFLFGTIGFLLLRRKYFASFHTNAFLLAYAIILLPFLVVNGFLTALPVVLYNNNENLAIRLYTIPIEDIGYGMLLVMLNVMIYEKLKSKEEERINALPL